MTFSFESFKSAFLINCEALEFVPNSISTYFLAWKQITKDLTSLGGEKNVISEARRFFFGSILRWPCLCLNKWINDLTTKQDFTGDTDNWLSTVRKGPRP